MDKRITAFIEEQKNLTICTSCEGQPYCASCFYAYMAEENFLVFKSDRKTKHVCDALQNDRVAGTIVPDISKTGTIKGIQLAGKFIEPSGDLLAKARKTYYRKFPFAVAIGGDFWIVELFSVKMTDNTLGFGKKLNWEKPLMSQHT